MYCEDGTVLKLLYQTIKCHLQGTSSDAKNQVYLIRKGVAGSAKSIHERFLSFKAITLVSSVLIESGLQPRSQRGRRGRKASPGGGHASPSQVRMP